MLGNCRYVLILYVAAYGEIWLLGDSGILHHKDHLINTFFLAVSVFCMFLKHEDAFNGRFWKVIAELGRKHSFVIYITHSIIIEILYKIVAVITKWIPILQSVFAWVGPIIVLALSTFLAIVIKGIKNRISLQSVNN